MNKPNITEGEWGIYIDTAGTKQIGTGGLGPHGAYPEIAEINHYYFNDEIRTSNAKAISAVPDMIDVLIKTKQLMQSPNGKVTLGDKMQLDQEIENALKKAGVEL